MTQIDELNRAIATLEAQRAVLGDAVVDTALAPVRARLAELEATAVPPEQQRKMATVMFADTAFANEVLVEYSFAEPRRFPTFGTRPDPSIHFRHDGQANVAWCDGHVDRHRRTFTYRSGFYTGDPALLGLGWFGQQDDNSLFDLE